MRVVLTLLLVIAGAATAHAQSTGGVHGAVVERGSGAPVADVTVLAKAAQRGDQIARTDATGHYALDGLPPDQYVLYFIFGNARVVRDVTIAAGEVVTADAQLEVSGETIVIKQHKPAKVLPQPVRNYHMVQPPYSDEATDRDVWANAWLLLHIDTAGEVSAVAFVKSAGYGLDEIAVDTAFGFHFHPARDEHGKTIESTILWKMDWPPYWRALEIDSFLSMGAPPCRGSGPLRVGSVHPVYRDCAVPDLAHADVGPWISRPGVAAKAKPPQMRPTMLLSELAPDERDELCHWARSVSGATTECAMLVPATCAAKVADLVTCTLRSTKGVPPDATCAAVAACQNH